MTRPCSDDLRERVVSAVEGCESCRSVATRFGVAVSSVVKWRQRYRSTGSVAPGQMGGHRKRLLESHRDFIVEQLERTPHLTLHGLKDIGEDQAVRIVSHIQDSDYAFKLETVDLGDEPFIELKDGEDYKNSADLSTGQRCTVILPILLLESERPLLIDQPEDNLDNAFVYDTIVKSLRDAKGGRQLIFVTHNPNIPVLGEAERVFVFSSDGRRGTVPHVGTVDDVKAEVEHLLEGGAEAFLLRMQKYGH